MKYLYLAISFALYIYSGYAHTNENEVPNFNFDEVYGSSIGRDQLSTAYSDGAYLYMFELAGSRIRAEAHQFVNSEKYLDNYFPTIDIWEFNKKLSPNKYSPPTERGVEYIELLEIDFGTTFSPEYGDLSLKGQASEYYNASKLIWNEEVYIGECPGLSTTLNCKLIDEETVCTQEVNTWIDYIRQAPQYSIYRIIDNNEELLTVIKGRQDISRQQISWGGNIWETINDIYHFESDPLKPISGEAYIYDFVPNYRPKGSTLEYKIVADLSVTKKNDCGSSKISSSKIPFDTNGDYKTDFLPPTSFGKAKAKFITPLLVANGIL